jgi:hypothetical protein
MELDHWRPPLTTLSPEQRRSRAIKVLSQETTAASIAIRAAKQLVGQWPHAKADDPEIYIAGLGAVLSGYPPGVVAECCDPRTGLARSREFPPTPAAVVEWCDKRLHHHRQWSKYVQVRKTVDDQQEAFSAEHRKSMLGRLSALMHRVFDKPQREAAE